MSALSILAEECELLTDSKYRSYITQVEKALKSFDSTSEWADLISALGKLNKVLLAHVKYPVIPKRVTIGKRLAQCLHPALPSGVHMKALETYDIIFKCIGTERLAQDLFIYTAGLFPLLSYAAMNVKPVLLMIYERHFVSLGKRIKPGLNGLLLGLLPGLEEGSESYDQTNSLLEDFCECTEPAYFYTCLWECVHSCPSVRLAAVTFLLTHFNKKKSMEDQLHMMGLNINLMVEAVCHAVQDTSVLVQRSLLDFLLVAFPLHNSQLTHSDMAKLVRAAVNVLLRRDMSLNRRFYAWLLGTSVSAASLTAGPHELKTKGENGEPEVSYFERYSKELLVQALKSKLGERQDTGNGSSVKSAILKPFRMLISLLDKPEIGPVILENVLLSIFRCLYSEFELSKSRIESSQAEKKSKSNPGEKVSAYDELLKTANLLFGTFEPYFIWDYAARLFDQSCTRSGRKDSAQQKAPVSRQGSILEQSDHVTVTELCQLVAFLLDIVSLETFSETQTEHLPILLCNITTSLTQHCAKLTDMEIVATLTLCTKILSKVQPTMTTPGSHDLGSHDVSVDVSHGLVEPGVEVCPETKAPEDEMPMSLEKAQEINNQLKAEQEAETEDKMSEKSADTAVSPDTLVSSTTKELNSTGSSTTSPDDQKGTSDVSENIDPVSSQSFDTNRNKSDGKPAEVGNTDDSAGTKSSDMLDNKSSKHLRSVNLMQQCIDAFQVFFHTLVTQKILRDQTLAQKCYESNHVSRSEPQFSQGMFDYDSCLDTESEVSYDDRVTLEDSGGSSGTKISLDDVDEVCLQTFCSACQLLVEFASFPMYILESTLENFGANRGEAGLPVWVQDLVTCCCHVDNFLVQSSAISTMLDLIVLTQSVHMDTRPDPGHANMPTALRILPTLHADDLQYLGNNTHFYKLAACILWGYLDETTPQYHQQTVKLFHILHQVAPSSWICENVIGSQLVHESEERRIDAFKKFTMLWHLTRNKKTGIIPGKPLRTFDRSMFVVLDSLREESSTVKVIATTWLTHIIQHGDISRVMEPILLMLLHPDTARVSIQHVNIHKPRKVRLSESYNNEENNEANIYAISSEGGNIIYHVSATKEVFPKGRKEDLKSYALTVLRDGSTSTGPLRSRSEQELHFDKVDPNNLNLRINPFGSESSLDKLIFAGYDFPPSYQEHVYNKAKRLDKETCAKEGISFSETGESTQGEETDDEQRGGNQTEQKGPVSEYSSNSKSSMNNSTESILDSTEDMIRGLLDDVIKNVIKVPNSAEFVSQPAGMKPSPRRIPLRSDSISSSNAGDHDLLNSVQKQRIDSPTLSEQEVSMFPDLSQGDRRDTTDIHTLHMHMLLYTQKYDYERTVYALSTFKSMLVSCPRLLVTSLVTTSISSLRAPQLAKLQLLLARHRKSVFGKNFFGEIPSEVMSNYRSSMFIEILISVCLYFIRGYYPNLMMSKLSQRELLGNKQVHIIATETLTLLLSEVIGIMRDSGTNFVSYISDLLQRCKVQKALLHCILAVIYNNRKKTDKEISTKITEAMIAFNEEHLTPSANETFQIKLLELMLVMIMLEDQIGKFQTNLDSTPAGEWDRLKVSYQPSLNNVRYNLGHPIVHQGMFVSGILSALKQYHMCHMHRHWVAMVTNALPYMGKYLPGIVMTVVSQLCRNIEALALEYEYDGKAKQCGLVPPDHVVTLLDGLMTLCHYCLLDNVSPVSIGQQTPTPTGTVPVGSSNILTNLFNVFNPVGGSRDTSPQKDAATLSPVMDARSNILSILPRIMACMTSLWRAIHIIEKVEEPATFTMGAPKVVKQYILEFVSPISLPHGSHLLGAIAVAWNDRRKKSPGKNNKKVTSVPCEDQLLLVELVSAIRVMPTDTLIQTVRQVLKSPPSSELSRSKNNVPLEVNMLQFFFAYVQKMTSGQLVDAWPALLGLLREALTLNLMPPGQFLLVLILNEFVQKTPNMVDKKNQRDVQEIAQRLLEAVSAIAGSCLEQTTWLRKNFAVKPGLQSEEVDHEEGNQAEEDVHVPERRVVEVEPVTTSPGDSKYSVHALSILADLTAPLLDVIYSSDEKDKVAPFLTTLLYNVFPYLKNHSCNNLPSLRASSQFLATISSYQYTRKAWRKEALELMLDPSFFQMDLVCIGYWLNVVDNLMTHDKTTYKDLMARVSMAQTGSLNLFTNREQEIDQKAGMLKRLAFTIFCSDHDQYQKSIPEIQEKLAESLRVPQAPSIMAQVFLCFRVLMLRVSPQHLTSMWPTIITELIHVFLQIEQELSTETEEFVTQVQRIAALDSSWAHLGNGLNAHNNPAWLQLYLSACKLLDLCLSLPADSVPQFQLYRWAFIGGAAAGEGQEDEEEDEEQQEDKKKKKKTPVKRKQTQFKPHIIRLARLLNTKLQGDVPVIKMTPGRPLLTFTYLKSLAELQPFFNTLCLANQTDNIVLAARQLTASRQGNQLTTATNGHGVPRSNSQSEGSNLMSRGMPKSKSVPVFSAHQGTNKETNTGLQAKTNKQYIEEVLKRDFLEPMP